MTFHGNQHIEIDGPQIDLLAMLSCLLDRVQVIKRQAWDEASWDAVYDEAEACIKELEALQAQEQLNYRRWFGQPQEHKAARAAATREEG